MRPRTLLFGFSGLLLIAVLGCGNEGKDPERPNKLAEAAVSILKKGTVFELHSLDPAIVPSKEVKGFDGYTSLGKTIITDAKVREKLLSALLDGIAKSDGSGAFCFEPRHGIRAKLDDQTVELLICFECLQIHVSYTDGHQEVLTTGDPQKIFDEVLKKADVPLPKPAGKE